MKTLSQFKHKGPHLGMLAIIFTILFNMGLSFVISLSATTSHYPGPWESSETIVTYFRSLPHNVIMCAFFQFGAAIPLGLFTAAVVDRLRFLGTKAVGPNIALFGGFMASVNLALSALILWVMSYPGIADDIPVIRALYYLVYVIGGVGYSVPLGLLIVGVSVTAGFMKLLPKWIIWFGIILGCFGELSCLNLVFPKLLPLIPLTRFPGFIWLIIAGFMLPKQPPKDFEFTS